MLFLIMIIIGIYLSVKYNISIMKVLVAVFIINILLRMMIFPIVPGFGGYSRWGYGGPSVFFFNNSRTYGRDYRYRDTQVNRTTTNNNVRRSSSNFRNRGTGYGK